MGPCKKCMKSIIAYFDAVLAMHSSTGVAQGFRYNLRNNIMNVALKKKKIRCEGPTIK